MTEAMAERPPTEAEGYQIRGQIFKVVPIEKVHESANNPRKTFDPKSQADLEASIREKGIIVPLLVRPARGDAYEIVAGARRYRAARAVGLGELPVLVRELTADQALEVAVIENLQRADVHPIEEAEGYAQLLQRGKLDVEAIAAKVGKSASYVYQRLKLADLIEPAKTAFLAGELTPSHAVLIARLQPADQKEALEICFPQDGYSRAVNIRMKGLLINVRELQAWISSEIHLDLHSAPWKKDDVTLVVKAGPCTTCPKRAGACPQLFPDIEKKDTCTDRGCFHAKQEAHIAREIGAAEIGGKKLQKIAGDWRGDLKKGILGTSEYHGVKGKKRCPTTVPAIYVSGPDLGKLTDVCTNRACKIHGNSYSSESSGSAGVSRTADEERAHQAELLKERISARSRKLLLRAVVEKTTKITREDLELIASSSQGLPYCDNDVLGGLFPILGKYDAYKERVEIPGKVSDQELARYLVAGALGDELGTYGDAKKLFGAAKRLKVDVAAILKQATTEKTNEKLHKEQVQKWKNRVASKASRYDEPTCATCGCTVAKACPGGCSWTKLDKKTNRGLCSACKAEEK